MAPKKGWVPSAEWREKRRQSQLGRRHTEETKRKMSAKAQGRKHTAASRAKMSAAKKGVPKTEERKRQISEKLKGRVLSEETKRRMSEAVKRRFQDPERRKAHGVGRRKFWASLTPEERSKIALPGRLACLEATRLREPTSIEVAVAGVLRSMGLTIETQVLFRYYIADIFIPAHNLVVECDGDYWHSTPQMKAHDAKRDRWFAKHDMKVVRIKECDIRANAEMAVREGLKGIL